MFRKCGTLGGGKQSRLGVKNWFHLPKCFQRNNICNVGGQLWCRSSLHWLNSKMFSPDHLKSTLMAKKPCKDIITTSIIQKSFFHLRPILPEIFSTYIEIFVGLISFQRWKSDTVLLLSILKVYILTVEPYVSAFAQFSKQIAGLPYIELSLKIDFQLVTFG